MDPTTSNSHFTTNGVHQFEKAIKELQSEVRGGLLKRLLHSFLRQIGSGISRISISSGSFKKLESDESQVKGFRIKPDEPVRLDVLFQKPTGLFIFYYKIDSDSKGTTILGRYSTPSGNIHEINLGVCDNEPHLYEIVTSEPVTSIQLEFQYLSSSIDPKVFKILPNISMEFKIRQWFGIFRYVLNRYKTDPDFLEFFNLFLQTFRLYDWQQRKALLKFIGRHRELPEYMYRPVLDSKALTRNAKRFSYRPVISIVMPVYNVDPRWLSRAVESVQKQAYPFWELCIADDCSTRKETVDYLKSLEKGKDKRIKITFLTENQNISGASNEAAKLATGEYLALLDNDDELTADALYENVRAMNEFEIRPDILYSDEDKLSMEGLFETPHYKSAYNPDLLLSQNYITHFIVFSRSIFEQVGGFRKGFEGSQDHDLTLRMVEKTNRIVHIPAVLYHWRAIPGSTAEKFDSKDYAWLRGVNAVQEALDRRGEKGTAEKGPFPGTYRVRRRIEGNPLVSIIIPFKDKPELLEMSVNSILDKSTYQNYEIILLSNNSSFEVTRLYLDHLLAKDKRIKEIQYNVPFNYSLINNYAAKHSQGEYYILMNNDIEIISPDWIEELLQYAQKSEVGAVGARLYYPNDTLQHAGVILGVGGIAGHSHKHLSRYETGKFARPHLVQNISGVTAALMMVSKEKFWKLNGLEENKLTVAFNDVDFCLRLLKQGYLNVYNPFAEAYHHESISRGYEDTIEKVRRFGKEMDYMNEQHSDLLANDSYYNPNLSLKSEDFFPVNPYKKDAEKIEPEKVKGRMTLYQKLKN